MCRNANLLSMESWNNKLVAVFKWHPLQKSSHQIGSLKDGVWKKLIRICFTWHVGKTLLVFVHSLPDSLPDSLNTPPPKFLLFTLLLSSFVETWNSHLASVCQFWYPGVFLAILVSLLLVAAFIDLVRQFEKGFHSFLPERTPAKCHHYLSSLWLHKVTQSCEG